MKKTNENLTINLQTFDKFIPYKSNLLLVVCKTFKSAHNENS